jgi:hypothetical protein
MCLLACLLACFASVPFGILRLPLRHLFDSFQFSSFHLISSAMFCHVLPWDSAYEVSTSKNELDKDGRACGRADGR